jgi:alpha-N-arabinofuranosidase
MSPEYYANLARQYGNFLRGYGKNHVDKIAVGPYGDNLNWTEVVMKEMGRNIYGLSLHYYTFAKGGETATNVTSENWFDMLEKTLRIEDIIKKNIEIMDKYDPGRNVALVVDEWGAWYTVEPGTNPGFLYQQNTLRDALIAGINLNIFNNYCSRVKMAAIAQMVNVLQSVVLTSGEKMLLTPTYHVFDMYKVHQDAIMVPSELTCEDYVLGSLSIPALNASASIDKSGKMHISICNLNPEKDEKLSCSISGYKPTAISASIIQGKELNSHNTFTETDNVKINELKGVKLANGTIELTVPAHSVVTIELTGEFTAKSAKAVDRKDLKPGLNLGTYNGEWSMLPDFSALTPVSGNVSTKLEIPASVPSVNFGLLYSGYIDIPSEGLYEFRIISDDGAKLSIDGEDIVIHDGIHGMTERQGNIFLAKGLHELSLSFFQGTGGYGLRVSYKKPDGKFEEIPAELLFSKK